MLFVYYIFFSFHIVPIRFDKGANIFGSSKGPDTLLPVLKERYYIDVEDNCILSEDYKVQLKHYNSECTHLLNNNKLPLVLGGDHSVSISSVFASNEYAANQGKKLGVLWVDAHADFNTIESSPSKNLHGMPVAVLCGHTFESIQFSDPLNTSQFAYVGVRSVDKIEQERFGTYNMRILNTDNIKHWIREFDMIHLSFDIDAIDSSIISSVSTPESNGLKLNTAKNMFKLLHESGKLMAMDIVELNPTQGDYVTSIINICHILDELLLKKY